MFRSAYMWIDLPQVDCEWAHQNHQKRTLRKSSRNCTRRFDNQVTQCYFLFPLAAAGRSDTGAERRLQDIVARRKLVDLAKAQAQEVAVLRAEVERLRMRTFPALVQIEH